MNLAQYLKRLDDIEEGLSAKGNPAILAIRAIVISVSEKHSPEEVNDLRARAVESIHHYRSRGKPGSEWLDQLLDILNDTPTPEPIQ